MTKFSFEVPFAHMEEFHPYQDYYFCLSFLTANPDYVSFIRSHSDTHEIIMDNSFNELKEPQTVDEVVAAGRMVNASRYVCPDSDKWDTEMMITAVEVMIQKVPANRVIVPVRDYNELTIMHNKGLRCAIPYEFRSFFPSHTPWENIHFLGFNSPLETKMCSPIACDTSMPLKLALIGQTVDGWIYDCCPHIHTQPDFFNLQMTTEQIGLAVRNIHRIKELSND